MIWKRAWSIILSFAPWSCFCNILLRHFLINTFDILSIFRQFLPMFTLNTVAGKIIRTDWFYYYFFVLYKLARQYQYKSSSVRSKCSIKKIASRYKSSSTMCNCYTTKMHQVISENMSCDCKLKNAEKVTIIRFAIAAAQVLLVYFKKNLIN